MAEQSAKLKVSELDYASIKSNFVAFLKSQSEFANFDFAGSGLDVIMDYFHIIRIIILFI